MIKFLQVQDQLASGTEPFAGAGRPDSLTYHFGQGRGVRWHDMALTRFGISDQTLRNWVNLVNGP